jgi:hypothetical protein
VARWWCVATGRDGAAGRAEQSRPRDATAYRGVDRDH